MTPEQYWQKTFNADEFLVPDNVNKTKAIKLVKGFYDEIVTFGISRTTTQENPFVLKILGEKQKPILLDDRVHQSFDVFINNMREIGLEYKGDTWKSRYGLPIKLANLYLENNEYKKVYVRITDNLRSGGEEVSSGRSL